MERTLRLVPKPPIKVEVPCGLKGCTKAFWAKTTKRAIKAWADHRTTAHQPQGPQEAA